VAQEQCVEECLKKEEDCLIDSISMTQCVIDFDTCHQICFPEAYIPDLPPPATVPGPPTAEPGTPTKHKDVTNDTTDGQDDDGDNDDEEVGSAVAAGATTGSKTKVLHGKGKYNGHGVKATAKEAIALTLTPEEINRLQQSYQDDEDDEDIISAPKGGEDDSEFDDDPSDY
ncbi:hypothetical protein FBU30_007418, partial [Linnemannia zychae]